MIRQLCVVWCGLWVGALNAAEPRYELLVAGSLSDNIVVFDLQTHSDRVLAKLANGSQPRALIVSPAGDIVVGLRGNEKNLVQLVPANPRRPEDLQVARPISDSIGRFGPGMLAVDSRGSILVAGDTRRDIQRTRLSDSGRNLAAIPARRANTYGLAIREDTLFVSEFFQDTILSIDLSADPPTPRVLIDRSEHLDRPCALAVGHNGHLFVASVRNDRIQEFDAETGRFLGTFLDVNYLGTRGVHNLLYVQRIGHYFLSSGDTVFELDRDGSLLNRYASPALKGAHGLAFRRVSEN